MPTINDIARETGLSIASVSNALNGKGRVSDEKRRLIIETAQRMGYDLGRVRGAEGRKSICVMLEHLSVGFCHNIAESIERAAAQNGYRVSYLNLDILAKDQNPDPDAEHMKALLSRRSAQLDASALGVIYVSQYPRDLTGLLPKLGVPVVYAYGYAKGAPCVNTDDQLGAYMAVRHLTERGRRRIAMISGPINSIPMTKRFSGYQRALIEAKLPVDLELVRVGTWEADQSAMYMRELLAMENRPDGIFCQSDSIAVGVLRAVKEAGLRVPEDISVVGFDDSVFSSLLDPPLSTVAQPTAQIGRRAFAILQNILEKREQGEMDVLLAPKLIPRGTS